MSLVSASDKTGRCFRWRRVGEEGGGGDCANGMSSERTREPRRMSFLWTLNSTPSLESKITSASRQLKGSPAPVRVVEATLGEYASMAWNGGE